jgi:DNA polymerase alpha subunit A
MKRLRNTEEDIVKPIIIKKKKSNTIEIKDCLLENFIYFYWIDIYEDDNDNGRLYLFGKIYNKPHNTFRSCVFIIDGIMRTLYFVPKEDKSFSDVSQEIKEIRQETIPKYRVKEVKRQYYFDQQFPQGINNYLKMQYSYSYPPFQQNRLKGKTYSNIFGNSTKAIENFLIQTKIMGPCWMKIHKTHFKESSSDFLSAKKSTTQLGEFIINNYKNITPLTDEQITYPLPSLIITSIRIQRIKDNKEKKSIIAISSITHNNININKVTESDQYINYIFIKDSFNNKDIININDNDINKKQQITIVRDITEHTLLLKFTEHLKEIDPDVIIGHDIDNDIQTIIERMSDCKLYNSFYLGRLEHNYKKFNNNHTTTGRLICNTMLSIKEIFKSKDYNLSYLSKSIYNITIKELDYFMDYNQTIDSLKDICINIYNNSLLTIKLFQKFNIIPLTKYLTTTCGNTWKRSLVNARAERIEYLLMHKFYDNNPKFIIPDKKEFTKSKYEGGYVLDPKKGFYDTIILLLDFQSLYPSIIKEFNICFTTLQNTKNHGVLPEIVTFLISKRMELKNLFLNEKNQELKLNYDIQQLAIKLVTNSIYGCLGFSNSRFYQVKIAETITENGRTILKNTVELIGNSNNIIYGDTDSIMIDTGIRSLDDAIIISNNIKKIISNQYNHIVLNLDKIFDKLLLLTKKKYVGRLINNNEIEIKGLEIVKKNYCDISSEIGKSVLDIIFSNNINNDSIKKFVSNELLKIRNNNNDYSAFILREKISRNIEEYATKSQLSHVVIAQRMKKCGIPIKPGQNINYIVCNNTNNTSSSKSECSFTPNEFINQKKTIDVEWYIKHQILPPLSRILQPLNISIDKIDNDCIINNSNLLNNTLSILRKNQNYDNCEKLNIKCDKCNKEYKFLGFLPVICVDCRISIDSYNIINALEKLINTYLNSEEIPKHTIYNQLQYLKSLFDSNSESFRVYNNLIKEKIQTFDYGIITTDIFY